MTLEMLGQFIGGIGLFLLGMQLMTTGLKQAAGRSLKRALEAATQSKLRGLLSGTLITAAVQSSSAVTVATLGFVNAGLLTLGQSIAVIYGCNIGTTMTGWLVALIGFKVKISAFALPMIGAGMLARIVNKNGRLSHFGTAIAGFGLFFIGLDFLRSSFDGISEQIPLNEIGNGPLALTLFVTAGFILTFLMQASAAVMAIALSLVHTGSITLSAAAALVIGANVGTTTTALLASIGATPSAKRISAAHVLFNLLTGAVGLIFLILLASWLDRLDAQRFDLVSLLALYHTLFNLTGVVMIWPLTDRMEAFLLKRFSSLEEDEARPRYLDDNILTTPSLAVEAMNRELARVSQRCSRMAKEAISAEEADQNRLEAQAQGIYHLVGKISEFNQELARQNLNVEISETLPISIRVARYYSEMARLSAHLPEYHSLFEQLQSSGLRNQLFLFQQAVIRLIDMTEIKENSSSQGYESHQLMRDVHQLYQQLKASMLEDTVTGHISPEESMALLDACSQLQRLAEQAEKASSHWSSTLPIMHRNALAEEPIQG
ncbi:Sodium-dependent phosphate transporter [Marinobacterium lacunae]|uniref:Sodium-dependent phosphate transporter n=1 Tax=Marinobacterium lacunae TaxID=1232683 RepID=A0A081G3W5_9GAMM|nr:Na/Pi cotransporter family protein [Marinobacterium lacunae]KEA65470.1 Sodium-dependent phosphate transporter [Marinobacterium lacunae]